MPFTVPFMMTENDVDGIYLIVNSIYLDENPSFFITFSWKYYLILLYDLLISNFNATRSFFPLIEPYFVQTFIAYQYIIRNEFIRDETKHLVLVR